jgi:hypothetical protein
VRRAMHILEGLGPQETKNEYDNPYDDPYFGQLFLAGAFWIMGYLHLIDISDDFLEGIKMFIEVRYRFSSLLIGVLCDCRYYFNIQNN